MKKVYTDEEVNDFMRQLYKGNTMQEAADSVRRGFDIDPDTAKELRDMGIDPDDIVEEFQDEYVTS